MKKEFKNRTSLAGTRIHVKACDIRLGDINDIHTCPIARATQRTLGLRKGLASVSSTLGVYRTPQSTFEEDYALPKRANKFILAFDDGKPVKPFSFALGKKVG